VTSMARLRRRLDRWARYADKVTPGWRQLGTSDNPTPAPRRPRGLRRAWLRYDAERVRRSILLWERWSGHRMEAGDD
jgi:hypothetical protein